MSAGKATGFKRLIQLDGSLFETFMMFTAEVTGTAILVFVGCVGCVGALSSTAPPHMQIALTFGLAITISLTIFGHISGAHVNPSVTIAAVILGKTSISTGGVYILGQCLGSILGYGLLRLVTPHGYRHDGNQLASDTLCVTLVNKDITSLQGLVVEILATWILILVCGAVWDSRNEKWSGGISIKLGLTVAALAMAAGPYSGCSMNSARSLGPALWNNNWKDHWVYWLGPILGSILGSLDYLLYSRMMPAVTEDRSANAAANPSNG